MSVDKLGEQQARTLYDRLTTGITPHQLTFS